MLTTHTLPLTSCPRPSSLDAGQTAFLFVQSLFEPVVEMSKNMYHFSQEQAGIAQAQGITRYTQNILHKVGDSRWHIASAVTRLAASKIPALSLAAPLVEGMHFTHNLVEGKNFPSLCSRLIFILCTGATTGYVISSLPGAAALEWNTLADAKAHYSGGTCPADPWKELMVPTQQCVQQGSNLQTCRLLISDKVQSDIFAFTRHASSDGATDPVSVLNLAKEKTCFFTSLSKESEVTKTCFSDLKTLGGRTVEKLPHMPLSKAHEGLEPGQTTLHIGMHHQDKACGFFHSSRPPQEIQSPVCVLSSLSQKGPVTQMCFNPSQPEMLTLKEVKGIQLTHADDQPVSVLITDPKAFGLNPQSATPPATSDQCSAETTSFSLWEAVTWWWTQKTPCKAQEL